MKFLVIFLGIFIFRAECRPGGAVEIEKLKLVKLPEEVPHIQHEDKHSEETKRILEQIDRINEALGYTRRAFTVSSKIVPSEGYFYPRATYSPIRLKNIGGSVRNYSPYLAKKIVHHRYELIPSLFNQQSYFYPAPYLQLPLPDGPRLFTEINVNNESPFAPNNNANAEDKNQYSLFVLETPPPEPYMTITKDILDTEEIIPNLIENEESFNRESKAKAISEANNEKKTHEKKQKPAHLKSSLMDDIFDVISEVTGDDEEEKDPSDIESSIQNDKYIITPSPTNTGRQEIKIDDLEEEKVGQLVGVTGKPVGIKIGAKPTKKPMKEADESIKIPFGFFRPNQASKDALREGGIVIQRLKVRKGGIAIAGPGGVATAGSGGTAIVGPGGIAFTHPRGLTIAGPGAKVISVPASTDLEEVALNASARNLPVGGVVVATGPVVYYSPDQ